MKKIKILIADDHSVVRIGLSTLLRYEPDFSVVAEADDGAAALSLARSTHPDVAIVDLMMPIMDGVAATEAIRRECPQTRVLILTSFHQHADVRRALDSGAAGVLAKHTADEDLISAIRTVAGGGCVLPDEIAGSIRSGQDTPTFTQRQTDILQAAARGLSNAEIGLMLGISKDMVKAHLKVIFRKLEAANRAEAIAIALQRNLLELEAHP